MTDSSIRLERVITLPAGSLLQYGNDSRESFYFYDANHNLKLDLCDKKVIEKSLGKNQFEFRSEKVSKADLRRFGRQAKASLAQVRRERNELRKSLPSATSGQCFAPSSQGSAVAPQGEEFPFRPALNLRTGRADPQKFYSLLDLMNRAGTDPVDPARCFMARAVVARERLATSTLSSNEIVIATGSLLPPMVLQALGLKNDDRLDAAYSIVQGAKRVHVDLSPVSRRP